MPVIFPPRGAESPASRPLGILGLFAALLGTACGGGGVVAWWVDGETPSLLVGTMHRGLAEADIPQWLREEVGRARVLVVETDPTAGDPLVFESLITVPTGTVQAAMTTPDWIMVVDAFRGLLNANQLDSLQPWFSQGLYVGSLLPEGPTMDELLMNDARGAGVRVQGLESWDDQARMLNALGIDDGVAGLIQTAQDPDATSALLDRWVAAYRAADLATLGELTMSSQEQALRPAYFEQIVFGRSEAWVPAIAAELAAGGAVIAVGHTHFLGDRGLVRLLEQGGAVLRPAW